MNGAEALIDTLVRETGMAAKSEEFRASGAELYIPIQAVSSS